MRISQAHTTGSVLCREKLSVSGAMYARALGNAAQRTGGRVAPTLLGQLQAAPRAAASPFLNEMARAPGALGATLPQQRMQSMMADVPHAHLEQHADAVGHAAAVPQFEQALQRSGRVQAQPGAGAAIAESFGDPFGGMRMRQDAPLPALGGASTSVGKGLQRQRAA